jgi:glycosyltransferase involved in cell wall biosynthesis
MQTSKNVQVAVLLATYNGARFVESQIKSLKENVTPFTLHWLDDHSTDETRDIVRATALRLGVDLREWHQDKHLGVPDAFFQLLECVTADIYLFCDQDDVWQAGKIDATVANLLPDIRDPVLSFSDCLMFHDDDPSTYYRISDVLNVKPPAGTQGSRSLMTTPALGQTCGLTRPLRDIYLRHNVIARTHAFMHSWWLYLVAHATGTSRLLPNAPTTLYRRHGSNVTAAAAAYDTRLKGLRYMTSMWKMQQWLRRGVSKQARGFILAAGTLPPGPNLDRLLAIARLVATLDRRQSPITLFRLARDHAMWPNWRRALWFSVACLCGDAKP